MKLLIESSSLISDQDILKFKTLHDSKKKKFILNWLDNSNLKNLISPTGKDAIVDSILDKGFDEENNKFMIYLKHLSKSNKMKSSQVYEKELNLINYLVNDGSLNPSEKWLYDRSLYISEPDVNLYKIKALTYASNKQMQSSASQQITPNDLIDEKTGQIKNLKAIQAKLKEIQVDKPREKEDKEVEEQQKLINKSGYSGKELLLQQIQQDPDLRDQIKDNQLNVKVVHEYVKKIIKSSSNLGTVSNELIDAGDIDDELNDLLRKREYTDELGREPIQLLNNKIKKVVQDATNKSLSGKK